MKGFSMLEIVISIAVAGIILAIVTNSFQISQIKKNQDRIVQTIVSSLEEQKANSQSGKEGLSHGIKFDTNTIIIFKGEYSSGSASNKIITVDSQFEITESITDSDNIISFSRLLGDSSENATITVTHIDDRVLPKNIVIKKTGTISVIE